MSPRSRARRTSQPALEPITLAQAKQHLRVDHPDDDELIEDLITVARVAAEDRCGRSLISCGWRLTADNFSPALELPNPPLISVQSVKYFDTDGTERTIDPKCYFVDAVSEPSVVVPAVGYTWPLTQDRVNAVVVDYTCGYGVQASAIPRPIVQWIKLAIGDMYENRNASSDRPNVPQNFADALLDPYIIWSL